MESNKLDNPTWYSLNETHKDFVVEYEGIKFYHPDYCPFGGYLYSDKIAKGIETYASLTNNFFVVANKPNSNDIVQLNNELVCNQMILDKQINLEINEHIVELQTEIHKVELFNLVNLVQPGYFKNKTSDLGNYYGVYKDGKLVAVTGERMKMNAYTELSAIVTHPDFTGKGYAKQLIKFASDKIFNEQKIPYLHVANTNIGAIKLYEKLGFQTRREISFWNLSINEK
ncbi:GNAT family N-acetyltransferase [Flavobacterium sp. HSC-61S13]|uniref:GNAT family N-acetyltransferase n=1 Tax=Flavobacterium sp. HSC-61S13 TaxID=2910963 RepID=UPI00209FFE05|nr:GNAT family N-acetyltransferase [Flavobacterium sp. HSC-61S13]MCP1994360.1 putative GNAT family acetyltransferase [Flavobacterium sp. HSC-61S13]